MLFLVNYTATTLFSTLSLHDALPILGHAQLPAFASTRLAIHSLSGSPCTRSSRPTWAGSQPVTLRSRRPRRLTSLAYRRSEEHTSELQSRFDLVCRLLLEKKKMNNT